MKLDYRWIAAEASFPPMIAEVVGVWPQVIVLQVLMIADRPADFHKAVAFLPIVLLFLPEATASVFEAVQFLLSAWRFPLKMHVRGLHCAWRNPSVALRIQPDIACMQRVLLPTPDSIQQCPKSLHTRR